MFLPLKSVQRLLNKEGSGISDCTRVSHNRQRAHALEKCTQLKSMRPIRVLRSSTGRRKRYYTSVKVITCLREGAVLGNLRAPRRVTNARRSSPSSNRNGRVVYRITLCRWISLPLARFSLDLAIFAIAPPPPLSPRDLFRINAQTQSLLNFLTYMHA